MKVYGRVEVRLHAVLTSAIDEGEWSVSRLGCFITQERAHGKLYTEGWVDSRAGLDGVEDRLISRDLRFSGNIPEERRSHLHCGRSLKSRIDKSLVPAGNRKVITKTSNS
jgi:hypothetical protein